MIRIDEIYNNTIWPWLSNNRSGHRLFLCDPFGRSDPDSVISFGNDGIQEQNYIFMFDQEPVHLEIHTPTFDRVKIWNDDLPNAKTTNLGYLITSEHESSDVDTVCLQYGWQSRYYFFHGWAALDWYRGYDRTWLINDPVDRVITKTFISPNRIIGGLRQHRLQMLYWIFKLGLHNNHISCPFVCPAENVPIQQLLINLQPLYPDISSVFDSVDLPLEFAGETGSPMHSCWLSLFDQSAESLLYLVTETVASGRRHHLTEKTFKPICLRMPFVLVATQGSLQYLRNYGFKTFSDFWDESYDSEPNDTVRIEKVAKLLQDLDNMSVAQKQSMYQAMIPVLEHNFKHFYQGGFEQVLWEELNDMLNSIAI